MYSMISQILYNITDHSKPNIDDTMEKKLNY